MSRTSDLEARRRALLVRCDEQRAELAYRLEQFRPSAQVADWTARAPQFSANHPLAWLAALAGIVALFRPRKLVSWLTFARGYVDFVARYGVVEAVCDLAVAAQRVSLSDAPLWRTALWMARKASRQNRTPGSLKVRARRSSSSACRFKSRPRYHLF